MTDLKCDCLSHFVRIGRADYHCVECNSDLTIDLTLLYDIGVFKQPTHEPWIFDDYHEEKQYKVGDFLNIGNFRYKVLKIEGIKVVCVKYCTVEKFLQGKYLGQ